MNVSNTYLTGQNGNRFVEIFIRSGFPRMLNTVHFTLVNLEFIYRCFTGRDNNKGKEISQG